MMRGIDTVAYLSALRDIVNNGKDVSLLISGSSMAPFLIHHRDTIIFGKPNRPLKKGDIVFYERSNGQFVVHRICKIKKDAFSLVGDGQTAIESPIYREQIFGLVKKVCRKGKWIEPNDYTWLFFEKVWLHLLPLRPLIIKMIGMANLVHNR